MMPAMLFDHRYMTATVTHDDDGAVDVRPVESDIELDPAGALDLSHTFLPARVGPVLARVSVDAGELYKSRELRIAVALWASAREDGRDTADDAALVVLRLRQLEEYERRASGEAVEP